MNIIYFNLNIRTVEDLKKEYRILAKKFHPDLNHEPDATEKMKVINIEYEFLFSQVETSSDNKKGHNVNDNFRSIINQLLKHEGITISIIGSWLWIEGSTYPIKEQLKELGFRFQRKSKKWYLGNFSKKKTRKSISWNKKIELYGIETLSSKTEKPLLN